MLAPKIHIHKTTISIQNTKTERMTKQMTKTKCIYWKAGNAGTTISPLKSCVFDTYIADIILKSIIWASWSWLQCSSSSSSRDVSFLAPEYPPMHASRPPSVIHHPPRASSSSSSSLSALTAIILQALPWWSFSWYPIRCLLYIFEALKPTKSWVSKAPLQLLVRGERTSTGKYEEKYEVSC